MTILRHLGSAELQLQPFLAVDPVALLAAQLPALSLEHHMEPPVAVANTRLGGLFHAQRCSGQKIGTGR